MCPVDLAVEGGVATVTMQADANRNALSSTMRAGLSEALTSAEANPAVRVVLLTHTGPVFCSGMDLREAAGDPRQGLVDLAALLDQVERFDKPLVVRAAGPARAGGLGLVAAADVALTVDSATFAFSEVRLGVVPAMISRIVLERITPRAGRELMLTGRAFDAHEAVRIGLLNHAVTATELNGRTDRVVRDLLLGEPSALAATKALVSQLSSGRLDNGALVELSQRFFARPQAQEGIAALREKRPAAWVGAAGNVTS